MDEAKAQTEEGRRLAWESASGQVEKREREEWGEAGPGGEQRVVIGPWARARVRVERQSAQPSSTRRGRERHCAGVPVAGQALDRVQFREVPRSQVNQVGLPRASSSAECAECPVIWASHPTEVPYKTSWWRPGGREVCARAL